MIVYTRLTLRLLFSDNMSSTHSSQYRKDFMSYAKSPNRSKQIIHDDSHLRTENNG